MKNEIVTLRNVRLSFPNLFVARAGDEPGAKPKYGATFILDKRRNAADINALKAAIEKCKVTSDKLKGNKRPIKSPLRDGAEKEHLAGYNSTVMFITARNHRKPGVVDRQNNTIMEDDSRLFAGCYVNARVEVFGYVHPKSGPGITFSLINLQLVGGKAEDAFGDAPLQNEAEGFDPLPDDDESPV